MEDITLVMLAAGNSTRFNSKTKKQWLRINHTPLWLYATNNILKCTKFAKVVITANPLEVNYMKNFLDEEFIIVSGGETRQESMKNALKYVDTKYVMISDVARTCVTKKMIDELILSKDEADCIVPALNVSDTVVYKSNTINRDEVKLIQTPQLSNTALLKKALVSEIDFTDDSSAIKNCGGSVKYIEGDIKASKLTFQKDKNSLICLEKPSSNHFVGFGYDVHPFCEDKKMFLGGAPIDVDYGFKAHSDGDVLIHSIIDALLGAIGAGDIGEFFPDTDEKYKGIDSKVLMCEIVNFVYSVGYSIVNIDVCIVAQKPKINPNKQAIKSSLSKLLGINKEFINIKATTSEKLGFIGRSEGIAVHSVASLKYFDWMD